MLSHRREGVSICIPNWNHRQFLPRSLRSAQKSLLALRTIGIEGEIIVIDDHSRDGSQRALVAMALADADGLIDVILLDKNRGLAAARNLALRSARFSHVCYLDADNELVAENFPLFWRASVMTRAAVTFGNLIAHDDRGADRFVSNFYVHESLYVDNYIDAFALYRAETMVRLGGFDEKLTAHEDWEMYLHLIAEGEDLVFVPALFGYYYIVSNSMVQTETLNFRRMHRIFAQRHGPGAKLDLPRRMFHPDLGWL